MKALSLLQPWAGLLALGIKGFETRSWNTNHRGRVAIHASARIPKQGLALLEELHRLDPMKGYNKGYLHDILTCTGCVLGEVDIVDTFNTDIDFVVRSKISVQERLLGDYSPGRYFWQCENPVLYTHPIPAKGALSIWNWDKPAA